MLVDYGDRWVLAVRDRAAVWQRLHETIADLSAADQGRLMAALHARVALPTEEERGAAELAEAEHDAAFWERMHGTSMKQVEGYQGIIAHAERKIAEERERAKREAENVEAAKAKAARLANYKGAR